MAKTITGETKKEIQRKAKRRIAHRNQKKRKKVIPFVVRRYFTHGSSNVAYMQIMKSNSNGRSKTNIACQRNLPLYSKG